MTHQNKWHICHINSVDYLFSPRQHDADPPPPGRPQKSRVNTVMGHATPDDTNDKVSARMLQM